MPRNHALTLMTDFGIKGNVHFFDAIDKMMENKDGKPGTSDFYRCASYHGNPPPIYCKHGREQFPGWHRIYLLDFEKALRVLFTSLLVLFVCLFLFATQTFFDFLFSFLFVVAFLNYVFCTLSHMYTRTCIHIHTLGSRYCAG